MTYEECERLVAAFEQATLLKNTLSESVPQKMAGDCADACGEFIASMMSQAWKRSVD